MQLTRRSGAVVALAAFTAAYGAIVGSPIPAFGAALVGAWLVGRQAGFTRQLDRVRADLDVTQGPARTRARVGESDRLTLSATIDESSGADGPPGDARGLAVDVTVTAGVPTAAVTERPLSVRLRPSMPEATASTAVEWPVAGRHEFDPATVRVDGDAFVATLSTGDRPTVTVDSPDTRSIHVGEGGERVAVGVGTHEEGRRGQGLDPAELREYTAGDSAARIDWKATARLSTPYVREYEAETDRRTAIVLDARRSLSIGAPGVSPVGYLTSVGLAIAKRARHHGDPLGLVVVDDDGVETRIPTSASGKTNAQVRRTLLDVEPSSQARTRPVGRPEAETAEAWSPPRATATSSDQASIGTSPSTAADAARSARLALDGDGAFDRALRPFYADRAAYVERVSDAPLFAAVDGALAREPGSLWTVVLTDDSARAELFETVANARTRGDDVLVAIAPQVLYERGGLDDLERAYERYAEFEDFRRSVGRRADVTALEVGPADRLDAVLEAGGDRR